MILAKVTSTLSGSDDAAAARIPVNKLTKALEPLETRTYVEHSGITYEIECVVRKVELLDAEAQEIEQSLIAAVQKKLADWGYPSAPEPIRDAIREVFHA